MKYYDSTHCALMVLAQARKELDKRIREEIGDVIMFLSRPVIVNETNGGAPPSPFSTTVCTHCSSHKLSN